MKSEDQREADRAEEQGECAHPHTRDSNVRGYKRCLDCGKLIGKEDKKGKNMNKLPTVLMYGGGRQTIAIIVLILRGKLPMPDFIVVADTGREKQTTWDYLDKYVRPSMPIPIHRILKEDWATVDLYRDTKAGDRYLLIPAFTKDAGGKLGINY